MPTNSLQLWVGSNRVYYYDVPSGGIDVAPTITQNAWHYCALQRSGSSIIVKVDGVTVLSGSTSGAYSSTFSTARIGSNQSGVGNFPGYLDDIRLTVGQTKDISVVPTAAFPNA